VSSGSPVNKLHIPRNSQGSVPPVRPHRHDASGNSSSSSPPQSQSGVTPRMMSEVPPPTIWDILKIQDISPGPEDRLVTCMDAKLEPACPVIPQVALHFRDLDEEDKTTFRRCRPHQQHQIALVTFLRYARGHHIEPPAELYRNLCRRVPSVDSKKRWACGMKGCKTGDTLEHIKTHLHGLTHFSYRFFPCPNW